jgi:hypothetical protein
MAKFQKKILNILIGIAVLYFVYSLFKKTLEGFSAPGGSPCDMNEDCDSSFCDKKEGVRMCSEVQNQISSAGN